MTEKVYRSWTFDITSPIKARSLLKSGKMPSARIRVLTEESPGNSDKPYRVDSIFGVHLPDYLNGIPKVLAGDTVAVEIDESIIRFVPRDDDVVMVNAKLVGVPNELLDEPNLIERDAFVTELYRAGKSWYDEAKAINPGLGDYDWFQDIETALQNAEAAIEEADIDIDHSSLGSDDCTGTE